MCETQELLLIARSWFDEMLERFGKEESWQRLLGSVFLGGFSPAHQLQLCKGWFLSLLTAASGCGSVWRESASFNGHLSPSVTECAPWQLKFSAPSCRFAALQRWCSQGRLAGSAAAAGPGQLCNRSPEFPFAILNILRSE